MNYFDIIVAILIIWFGYKGFSKGFIIELASTVALIVGVYAGMKFSHFAAGFLDEHVSSEYLQIASFAVTFLIVVLAIFLLGKSLEKIVDMVALSFVNKVLGAGLAIAKVLIITSVALSIVNAYNRKMNFISEELIEDSIFYKPLLGVADMVLPELEKGKDYFGNLTDRED